MVNNTVKTGKAAGLNDNIIITATGIKQKAKELEQAGKATKNSVGTDYIVIPAHNGKNPNKNVEERA